MTLMAPVISSADIEWPFSSRLRAWLKIDSSMNWNNTPFFGCGYDDDVLAESYLHSLSPFAIQFSEAIGLRWYGLAYLIGFLIAWLLLRRFSEKGLTPLTRDQVSDFVFSSVLGVVIGGRLGYALFYNPELITSFEPSFPWWELLAIHRGGMSSHGGMLGVLGTMIYWSHKHKIGLPHLMDIGPYVAIPGLFLGRVANFINGELWGRAIPENTQQTPPWWSVKYPTEITEVWAVQPEQYHSKLHALQELQTTVVGGTGFYHNVVQEAYSGNEEVVEFISPLLTAWYPSQLFQAATNGLLLFIILSLIWWTPKKEGVIAGWFLVVYGFFRVVTEGYRQPDIGVSLIAGLTRGQLLSVVMIFSGSLFVYLFSKRQTQKVGSIKNLL